MNSKRKEVRTHEQEGKQGNEEGRRRLLIEPGAVTRILVTIVTAYFLAIAVHNIFTPIEESWGTAGQQDRVKLTQGATR